MPTGLSAEVTQATHDHPEGLPRAARGAMAQHDARVIDSLDTVGVPSLIIVGDRDTDYLAAADYMQRHIPNARKVVIDDAGHASNMENPDSFNAVVRAFLEQL
jgi:pimeloyl-ACP methyl ester carboxylesterase